MAAHDELAQATAAELAGRIRRRELSPVEVMDAAIGRIESDNERLNAFVHLDLEQARERARQAESAVGSGAALGPLHGVPTAMKDLFDFKPGWPTTFGGVRALKDFVADFYCAWAERMERAGGSSSARQTAP
jgi:amidase